MGLAGAAAACFEGGYVLQAYEARRAHLRGRSGAASAGQLGGAAPAGAARRGSGFLGGWLLLLSAGAADAWSALATKIVSDEIGGGRWGFALAWAVGAGAMFGLGLLS